MMRALCVMQGAFSLVWCRKNFGLVANIVANKVVNRKSTAQERHKNTNVGLKYGYMRIIKKQSRFILRIIKISDKMCV